jgi:hypothetical protein
MKKRKDSLVRKMLYSAHPPGLIISVPLGFSLRPLCPLW